MIQTEDKDGEAIAEATIAPPREITTVARKRTPVPRSVGWALAYATILLGLSKPGIAGAQQPKQIEDTGPQPTPGMLYLPSPHEDRFTFTNLQDNPEQAEAQEFSSSFYETNADPNRHLIPMEFNTPWTGNLQIFLATSREVTADEMQEISNKFRGGIEAFSVIYGNEALSIWNDGTLNGGSGHLNIVIVDNMLPDDRLDGHVQNMTWGTDRIITNTVTNTQFREPLITYKLSTIEALPNLNESPVTFEDKQSEAMALDSFAEELEHAGWQRPVMDLTVIDTVDPSLDDAVRETLVQIENSLGTRDLGDDLWIHDLFEIPYGYNELSLNLFGSDHYNFGTPVVEGNSLNLHMQDFVDPYGMGTILGNYLAHNSNISIGDFKQLERDYLLYLNTLDENGVRSLEAQSLAINFWNFARERRPELPQLTTVFANTFAQGAYDASHGLTTWASTYSNRYPTPLNEAGLGEYDFVINGRDQRNSGMPNETGVLGVPIHISVTENSNITAENVTVFRINAADGTATPVSSEVSLTPGDYVVFTTTAQTETRIEVSTENAYLPAPASVEESDRVMQGILTQPGYSDFLTYLNSNYYGGGQIVIELPEGTTPFTHTGDASSPMYTFTEGPLAGMFSAPLFISGNYVVAPASLAPGFRDTFRNLNITVQNLYLTQDLWHQADSFEEGELGMELRRFLATPDNLNAFLRTNTYMDQNGRRQMLGSVLFSDESSRLHVESSMMNTLTFTIDGDTSEPTVQFSGRTEIVDGEMVVFFNGHPDQSVLIPLMYRAGHPFSFFDLNDPTVLEPISDFVAVREQQSRAENPGQETYYWNFEPGTLFPGVTNEQLTYFSAGSISIMQNLFPGGIPDTAAIQAFRTNYLADPTQIITPEDIYRVAMILELLEENNDYHPYQYLTPELYQQTVQANPDLFSDSSPFRQFLNNYQVYNPPVG